MVVFEWLFLQFRQHERVDKDAPFFLMAEKIGFWSISPKKTAVSELMLSLWAVDKFDQLQFLNHTML
jgi:hypothetical protein